MEAMLYLISSKFSKYFRNRFNKQFCLGGGGFGGRRGGGGGGDVGGA